MVSAQGDTGGRPRRPDRVVEKDPAGGRLVVREGGEEAELTYRRSGERLSIVHTGVPPALEGQGIGGTLVRAALDLARAEGLTVVPYCPFARRWLEDHPDASGSVAVDWP
jgi:predicted GNAT family acetyltransferase